jgi:hypothetical protein
MKKALIIDFIKNSSPNLSRADFNKFLANINTTKAEGYRILFDYVRGETAPRIAAAPPICPVCGKRHPHFVHGSGTGIRGAGRGVLAQPHSLYKMHMSPEEIEGMVYGVPLRNLLKSKGVNCPAEKWEHAPYTKLGHFGNEDKKKLMPLWLIIGLLALIGLFSS